MHIYTHTCMYTYTYFYICGLVAPKASAWHTSLSQIKPAQPCDSHNGPEHLWAERGATHYLVRYLRARQMRLFRVTILKFCYRLGVWNYHSS